MKKAVKFFIFSILIILLAVVAFVIFISSNKPRLNTSVTFTKEAKPQEDTYVIQKKSSAGYGMVFWDHSIKILNTEGREIANIENDENVFFVGDAIWSPDGNTLAYTNQAGTDYVLNLFNVPKNITKSFSTKSTVQLGKSSFSLKAWNEEKNAIIAEYSSENDEVLKYMDMKNPEQGFVEIPQGHGYWAYVSDDGRYLLNNLASVSTDCGLRTDTGEIAPSIYGIFDPITGNKIGQFGEKDKETKIFGIIQEHDVIYAIHPPENGCNPGRSRLFFRKNFTSNADAIQIAESVAYELLLSSGKEFSFDLDDIELDNLNMNGEYNVMATIEGIELPKYGPVRDMWKLYKNNEYGFSFLYPAEQVEVMQESVSDQNSYGFVPLPKGTSIVVKEKKSNEILFGIYHANSNGLALEDNFSFDKDRKMYVYNYFGGLIYKKDEDCTVPFMGHKEIPSATVSWGEGFDFFVRTTILNENGDGFTIAFNNTMQGPGTDLEWVYHHAYIDALRIYVLESLKFDGTGPQPIKFLCKLTEYDLN